MTSSVIVNRKQKFTADVTLPSSILAVSCCLPDFGAWEAVFGCVRYSPVHSSAGV